MKRPCKSCGDLRSSFDLYQCQTEKCSNKGPAYCKKCVTVKGSGLSKVFTCKPCIEKSLKKSRNNPDDKEKTPLHKLRKYFGVSQQTMADYIGIGRRQFQGWEKERFPIQESAKLLLYQLCLKHAPEFAPDWETKESVNNLMPPLSDEGRSILLKMDKSFVYERQDIKEMSLEPDNMELRTFNKLVRHGFIKKVMGGYLTNEQKIKDWRHGNNEKEA